MTEQDLDEFTDIRTLIEVPTVGRVTEAASVEQLETLRPLAEEIVAAAREHDVIRYLEADHRFHLELLTLAGNHHLVEVVADLRKRSRLFGLASLNEAGRLIASAQEHVELLDLMVAGRAQEAQDCMRQHLAHVRTLWADGRAGAEKREPALRLGGR
jgi:DNA-binding GntR family transcriptional regulator